LVLLDQELFLLVQGLVLLDQGLVRLYLRWTEFADVAFL
jgi:hypothetical protein